MTNLERKITGLHPQMVAVSGTRVPTPGDKTEGKWRWRFPNVTTHMCALWD